MPSHLLVPDLFMSERYLNLLDPRGVFTFQTFSDKDSDKRTFIGRDGKPKTFDPNARVFHGTLAEHGLKLGTLNQQGVGIFVMVNQGDGITHTGFKTCRTTASVIAVRSLFADLDGAPLGPVMNKLIPHILVESSPRRWHCYWLTHDLPLSEFKRRQQQIAQKFNADPKVCDLPRVMRLPGFYHHKREPFMTRLVRPE